MSDKLVTSGLVSTVVVAVDIELVRLLGPHRAIVLQQIHYWNQTVGEPETHGDLGDRCGMSARQIRAHLKKLGEWGLVDDDREVDLGALAAALEAGDPTERSRPNGRDEGPNGRGCATKRSDRTSLTGREAMREKETALEDTFDKIWEQYRKKLDRKPGLKAFLARAKVLDEEEFRVMLWATRKYCDHWAEQDEADLQFMKHASTWFGPGEPWRQWTDGIPAGASTGAKVLSAGVSAANAALASADAATERLRGGAPPLELPRG